MISVRNQEPISKDPEVMSGARVFAGTRVPVSALLENLAAGVSIDEFLENFPTVSREQAATVIAASAQPDTAPKADGLRE